MNAREVERELTVALHRHAEDAMSHTDTHEEHLRFQARAEDISRSRSRLRVVGAGAAVAAAVVGFVLWSVGPDHRADPGPARDQQTPAESVAQGLVDAVAAGDAEEARRFVAPVLMSEVRTGIRENAAWSRQISPQPCAETSTAPNGTLVMCTFEMHELHSQQLGLGPWVNNSFTLRVKDGRVVEAEVFVPTGPDSPDQIINRLRAWVRANHPGQWGSMSGDPHGTPAQKQRWYRLWKGYSQEYADAMTRSSNGTSPTS